MNNTQLEYFVEAMRTGSYRKAAKRLYISPQAIAQSIKRLEHELGSTLMQKQGREIVPTPLAIELFPYAERLVVGFSDFAARVHRRDAQHSEQREIKLGITEAPLSGCLFDKDTLATRAEAKGISVQLHFLQNEACKDGLREGLLDAAVIQGSFEEGQRIGCKYFHSAPLCVFSSSRVAQPELDLEDFQNAHIAVPTDTHVCFSYIRNLLLAFNVHASFDLVENSERALHDFMQRGGFIFGYGASPIDQWDDAVRHSIKADDKNRLSFYFCSTGAEAEADKLHAFLLDGLVACLKQHP